MPSIHGKSTLCFGSTFYTQRNLFEILSNQTGVRFYLPFSDWFGTEQTSVWFQIIRKIVYTIWFRFDLIRFQKDLSVFKKILWSNIFYSLQYFCSQWIELGGKKLYKVVTLCQIVEKCLKISYFWSNCRYLKWFVRYNGFSNRKFPVFNAKKSSISAVNITLRVKLKLYFVAFFFSIASKVQRFWKLWWLHCKYSNIYQKQS